MAPPIPVFSQKEIKDRYPGIFNRTNKSCTFHELTQNQCTFNGKELICLPFTRIFARCQLDDDTLKVPKYLCLEITDVTTNDYAKTEDDVLKRFLEADQLLRKAYYAELEA